MISGAEALEFFPIVAFFLFGLVFGSFLNVCIYRMPRGLSVVHPRSACPACGRPIAGYDNIPVVSWLLLRGRCRHCSAPISPRYAGVELLTGFFFAFAWHHSGGSMPEAVKDCVFCFLLIGLIFTDAETQLLPDLLTKPGIAVGLLFSLVVELSGPAQMLIPAGRLNWRILSLVNSLAGAFLGGGFILGVALLYEAWRGVEGMGMGDVKLMALVGAFLGAEMTLLVLILGSALGSLFGMSLMIVVWRKRLARRRRRRLEAPATARAKAWNSARLIYRNFEIPFGVFLGTAAIFAAFWGWPLVHWYWHLYR
ncbi:MAG TPA: prepilin peptidase [Candidatus Angelobacter sp.]|nr:prepilin peptidase [Candidatus Angelobacter sp.]